MLLTKHFAQQCVPHAHVGLLCRLLSDMLPYNNQSLIIRMQCNNPRSQTPNLPLHTVTVQLGKQWYHGYNLIENKTNT